MASRVYVALVLLTIALCAFFTFRTTAAPERKLAKTKLIEACAYQDDSRIKRLVREGYDINEIGLQVQLDFMPKDLAQRPTTPLMTAVDWACGAERLYVLDIRKVDAEAFQKAYERIEMLCQLGADPNKKADGISALHLASGMCAVRIVDLLIQLGADPASKDKDGKTALHQLARQGYQPFLKEFHPGLSNWTRHIKTFQILLRRGCPVDAKDKWGRTPLHYASQSGHLMAISILLSFGADPNAKDIGGLTPIDVAASQEALEALKKGTPFMQLPDRLAF